LEERQKIDKKKKKKLEYGYSTSRFILGKKKYNSDVKCRLFVFGEIKKSKIVFGNIKKTSNPKNLIYFSINHNLVIPSKYNFTYKK
jgi:hypothetical protein